MSNTINQKILYAMDEHLSETCFQMKQGQRYVNISYRRFQMSVFQLMKNFANQGFTHGDRIVFVSTNSLNWWTTYIACLLSGGVPVPLRPSLSTETLLNVVRDCQPRWVIAEDVAHILAVDQLLKHSPERVCLSVRDLPDLDIPYLEEVTQNSPPPTVEEQIQLRQQAEAVSGHSLAWIHYIHPDNDESNQPNGACFEQIQLADALDHIAEWFTFEEDDVAFTILSWSDSASLLSSLHYFVSGVTNALADNFEHIPENMKQTSPTIMLSNPFTFQKFYEGYTEMIAQEPEANQEMYRWAIGKGREYLKAGDKASARLKQEYLQANMSFFNKIRGTIGGRIRLFYSTRGTLPQELLEFYQIIGFPIRNVYSLIKAGGFPAVTHTDHAPRESCGQIAPSFEVKVANDGELLMRGTTVFRRYWGKTDALANSFTQDGWLRSGDLGHLDEDNYLYITGRKQHVMVLSMGHKFSASAIEKILVSNRFITQAAVVGDGKPYVSAMIVPDLNVLQAYFEVQGERVETTTDARVKALLDQVIGEVNTRLDKLEQIREYSLLDQPLSSESGVLTASMRIKRQVVAQQYAAQIEAMYPVSMRLRAKEVTRVEVEPDRFRNLIDKERILDAWLADAGVEFLFDIARQKGIDAPSMVNISDTAISIAQMENEEKPLSTAFIVGDPIRIARLLPSSQIQLLQHDHIRRMRKVLVTLAKMVDGQVLGYVVDKYGYVRGVHRLNVPLIDQDDFLLGPQFRRHAAISQRCNAIVFYVPAGGRQVRVFANGQLVGRYASGDWTPDRVARIEQVVEELAQMRQYQLIYIKRILRCAFQMSEQNMGAIFLLGNADLIFEHSDISEISSFASIHQADLISLSDEELINFAKQDGATIIDLNGEFRGCMVLLRPRADTQAEIGPGKGARHSSAAKMSAEVNCLAITVSQDGPITAYESGRRVLQL